MDNDNILQKRREREKLNVLLNLPSKKNTDWKCEELVTEKGERNTTENDKECMLIRKCVC